MAASPSNAAILASLKALKNEIANLRNKQAKRNAQANNNKRLAAILSRYGFPGAGRSRYELKDGAKTPFFDGRMRRFWYSPEIGFYIKVFNPRTRKLVSVPRPGVFRYQNIGSAIIPYRSRRPRTFARPSTRMNNNVNRWLGQFRGYAGYKENAIRPENLYKYYYR